MISRSLIRRRAKRMEKTMMLSKLEITITRIKKLIISANHINTNTTPKTHRTQSTVSRICSIG